MKFNRNKAHPARADTVNLAGGDAFRETPKLELAALAGTNFHAVFENAKHAYDRIILLSDMQGWVGGHAPTATFAAYRTRHACDPKVYSFDLAGYGTLQFPERNVFCLAGFTDKALETLKLLDGDADALVRQIEAVEL